MDPDRQQADSDPLELLASRRPGNNEVDAYERVLTDAMGGDRILFAREDQHPGSVADRRSGGEGQHAAVRIRSPAPGDPAKQMPM